MDSILNLKLKAMKRLLFIFILLAPGLSLFADTLAVSETPPSDTILSNPLFLTLLTAILFFFVIIIVLADVVKNIGKGIKTEKGKSGKIIVAILFLIAIHPSIVSAQTLQEAANTTVHNYEGLNPAAFWSLLTFLAVEVVILVTLLFIIRNLVASEEEKRTNVVMNAAVIEEPSLFEKLNASVPLEEEMDILMDHNYDGIRELDNNLPPWWKYGFIITIVIAVIYLVHYHVIKTGDLQLTEYKNDLKAAALEQAEFQKSSKNLIDEHTVKLLTDRENLAKGKELFIANCAACHLPDGGGIVGPNLTDAYWLHGGSINDIFKTIKYGYQEKGMKSWKEDFSPSQIATLASYVKSLKGTHPAVPKEPQGEIYTESGSGDNGPGVKTDSLKVVRKDSVSK
jgi:cytochrome c oxidase cbb3-type subunit 3